MIQPQPPGFKIHSYTFSLDVKASIPDVWKWLNEPKTFTDTQIWPYKVEFYSPDPAHIPNGFHEGVLTNHTGPFINFAGVITQVKPNYRILEYYYGSYAISFRWIRPFQLSFVTNSNPRGTTITCTISSYVKPSWYNTWDWLNRQFWKSFQRMAKKNIVKQPI